MISHNSSLEWFTSKCPEVPAYVIQDMIYKGYKDEFDNPKEIKHIIDWANSLDWKKQELNVTMDIWDKDTQRRLKERDGGSKNPYQVPNDKERHAKQKQLIANGPSKEPVIVELSHDGLELLEGWHRTIQSMEAWPEGYKQVAWVGKKKINEVDQMGVHTPSIVSLLR